MVLSEQVLPRDKRKKNLKDLIGQNKTISTEFVKTLSKEKCSFSLSINENIFKSYVTNIK